MPVNPQRVLTSSKLRPLDPDRAETISVRLPAGVTYPAGQVLEEANVAAATEVQVLTITGSPAGGSFVVGYPSLNGGYDVTAAIAYNAAAADVQAALEAVVGTGNVVVTGSPGGPWTLTYAGELTLQDIALPTLVVNSLTGGSSPTVTPTVSTAGSPGAVGAYQAYSAGHARCVLESNTRTDLAGRIIDEFGAGTTLTAVAYSRGTFLASDLSGLDATAVPSDGTPGPLGRLTSGATAASAGATVRVGG